MWKDAISQARDGIKIKIDVNPGAKKTGISGYDEWRKMIKVSVKEEARDGKANAEVIEFFSKMLDLSSTEVCITSGQRSRHKSVLIRDIEINEVIDSTEVFLGSC